MNKILKSVNSREIRNSLARIISLVFCLSIIACIAVRNIASTEAVQAEQEGSLPPDTFDTFDNLIAETDFTAGMVVQTRGYYQLYDGGSAAYRIVSTRPDTYCEVLSGGLFAALISDGFVNPKMFGAYGDGEHDDTRAVQNAIDFAYDTNSSLAFPTGTVYSVSTITLSHGNQSIDFGGCTLKALNEGPVLNAVSLEYNKTVPDGYLKNVTIDMNHIAKTGLYVDKCWCKMFENININFPAPNGTALRLGEGKNSACQNLFQNIRGRGAHAPGSIFMVIDAGDNYFDNIGYSEYQYGFDVNRFSIMSNVTGYLVDPNIYPGSYFIKLNSSAQLSNIYPDTQQYLIIANGDYAPVSISNLVVVFNTHAITDEYREHYPSYIIKTSHYFKTRNMVINGLQVNTDIYDNDHFNTMKHAPIQVNGYGGLTRLPNYTLSRPGITAVGRNEGCCYLSAGFDDDPILYAEGYHDVITANIFIGENLMLCKWHVSQRFTPQAGMYPAVLYCADLDEELLVILKVECGGSNSAERIVSINHSMSAGDKLYIDLPVFDHPSDLFNKMDS